MVLVILLELIASYGSDRKQVLQYRDALLDSIEVTSGILKVLI